MAAKKAGTKARSTTPRKPRRKKAEPRSRGLSAAEVASEAASPPTELIQAIQQDGGQVLAVYRDPLGAHTVVFAVLPIDKVEPTPYQRDLSEPHVKRLANAMERLDRYLDPVIAVRKDGKYWTPNGNHRLNATKLLGAKSIVALVLPEEDVAYQILALNTEKAHNLKERSLEVIRMHRGLTGARAGREADFANLFEEPSFITLGAAYEKRPRFAAGAYHPFVKRAERFLDVPMDEALKVARGSRRQAPRAGRRRRARRRLAQGQGLPEPLPQELRRRPHQLPALQEGRQPRRVRPHRVEDDRQRPEVQRRQGQQGRHHPHGRRGRCGAGRGVGSQARPRAPPPCRAAIWKPARRCPKLAGMAIKNLVFQGGGVKGIAYVGALQVLQARDLLRSVENVAGTSAGAITAALVAVGATAEEMQSILGSTDFASFMDGRGRIHRRRGPPLRELWHPQGRRVPAVVPQADR